MTEWQIPVGLGTEDPNAGDPPKVGELPNLGGEPKTGAAPKPGELPKLVPVPPKAVKNERKKKNSINLCKTLIALYNKWNKIVKVI